MFSSESAWLGKRRAGRVPEGPPSGRRCCCCCAWRSRPGAPTTWTPRARCSTRAPPTPCSAIRWCCTATGRTAGEWTGTGRFGHPRAARERRLRDSLPSSNFPPSGGARRGALRRPARLVCSGRELMWGWPAWGAFWRKALELRVGGGGLSARGGGWRRRFGGAAPLPAASVETRSSVGSTAHVCVHVHVSPCRLIVGAPTANWLANASVVNPGAIYRCKIGKNPDLNCEQLQLGELGLGPGELVQVLEKLIVAYSSLKWTIFTRNSKPYNLVKTKVTPFFPSFFSLLLTRMVAVPGQNYGPESFLGHILFTSPSLPLM